MDFISKESIALTAAIGALAGAIGAIISASITKLLEILLEKRKQSYSLQKEYFTNKIKTAEKATVQLLQLSNAFTGIGNMLVNIETTGPIVEEYNAKVIELSQNIFTQASQSYEAMAIHVYFDLTTQIRESFSFGTVLQDKLNQLQLLFDKAVQIQHDTLSAFEENSVKLENISSQTREIMHELRMNCDKMSIICLETITQIRNSLQIHRV